MREAHQGIIRTGSKSCMSKTKIWRTSWVPLWSK